MAFACKTQLLHTVGNVQNIRIEAGGQQYHGPAQCAWPVFCAFCSASAGDTALGGWRAVALGSARALDVAFQDYRIVLLQCMGDKMNAHFSCTCRTCAASGCSSPGTAAPTACCAGRAAAWRSGGAVSGRSGAGERGSVLITCRRTAWCNETCRYVSSSLPCPSSALTEVAGSGAAKLRTRAMISGKRELGEIFARSSFSTVKGGKSERSHSARTPPTT